MANIYQSLDKKSFVDFKDAFLKSVSDNKIVFEHEPTQVILNFIDTWFNIVSNLNKLNNLIEQVKDTSTIKQANLSNDDWVTIVTPLLPHSSELLELSAKKIEWLSRICLHDEETNKLLRRFMLSISHRIHERKKPTEITAETSSESNQLSFISQQVYNHIVIERLHLYCKKYLDYTASYFGNYIHDNDTLGYSYLSKFEHPTNYHSWIDCEVMALNFDALHININDVTMLLITKYTHVKDLLNTLEIKTLSTDDQIALFCDRFTNYLSILNQSIPDVGYSLFKSYQYINHSYENQLIKNCTDIVNAYLSKGISSQDNHRYRT